MSSEPYTISGPEEGYNIPPYESLGEYFINCLRKKDKDAIINVDAITGKIQTCEELLEDTLRAVNCFQTLGLKKGDIISIVSENRVGYNVPVLAALCIGAIVNPLSPDSTKAELTHYLSITKPKLLICSSTAIDNAKEVKEDLHFIQTILTIGNQSGCRQGTESFEALLESTKTTNYKNFKPQQVDISQDVALILMSSGTTGLPKGVMLTHENIRLELCYFSDTRYFGLAPGDSILILLPCYHIFGMLLYMSSMCETILAVILKKFHPNAYLETVEKYTITKLHMVPTLAQFLIKSDIVDNYNLASIKSIVVGTAPISDESCMKLRQRFPKATLIESYGTTETTGPSTYLTKFPKKPNCVGQLFPSLQAKIWDPVSSKNLKCLETGEICLKGSTVMKGYANVANNNSIIDEERFYHTGDMSYYDAEGNLYIVDRFKELIKYKGFQVSPTQIELILLSHPDIKDCAVIGKPDEKSGELPMAFVVRQTNSQVAAKEIISFVAERVSNTNRLHGGVIFVDTIPKTSSGKILRRELRELLQKSAKNS